MPENTIPAMEKGLSVGANTIEFDPGLRWHWSWLPPGVYFSTDLLRGVYTNNQGNPRRPNYTDLRIGFWYARSR